LFDTLVSNSKATEEKRKLITREAETINGTEVIDITRSLPRISICTWRISNPSILPFLSFFAAQPLLDTFRECPHLPPILPHQPLAVTVALASAKFEPL